MCVCACVRVYARVCARVRVEKLVCKFTNTLPPHLKFWDHLPWCATKDVHHRPRCTGVGLLIRVPTLLSPKSCDTVYTVYGGQRVCIYRLHDDQDAHPGSPRASCVWRHGWKTWYGAPGRRTVSDPRLWCALLSEYMRESVCFDNLFWSAAKLKPLITPFDGKNTDWFVSTIKTYSPPPYPHPPPCSY